MDDGDITDRGDFDRAVQARFPKARRHRKELPTGFEDTFRVGFVEVGIRVWDTKLHGTPSYKPNVDGLVIEVRGIRQAVGGSSAALWRKHGSGWGEACEALDTLREELLGLSHGLSRVCGRKGTPVKISLLGDDIDVTDLI